MRRHKATAATIAVITAGAAWLFGGPAANAAPPALDVKPVVADTLVQGKWQPLLVTVQNDDSGEAVQGEIQIALEDLRRQERLATYTAPVTLPRGAATVRVPVTVYIPSNTQPDLSVFVVNGRGGSGTIVTRRRFDKIPTLPFGLTLLAVSGTPDALQTLNGERLGVLAGTSGGLRAAVARSANPAQRQSYQSRNLVEMPVRVANRPDASVLPARSAGYEPVSVMYLGRDVLPDTFTDAQVNALRGWVAGGGLLVAAGPKLRTDERFRTWLPVPGATAQSPFGRGSIATPLFDPAETVFAQGPTAKAFWRKTTLAGVSTRNVAPLLSASGNYGRSNFWNSLFRAPGLQAPGATGIAVFLGAYLLLLVPVTYVVLRKLDKREWMWATAPILVLVFSLGAYGFGYATKGTQLFQNVATVSEMQNGSGTATTCAGIALFSPRRTRYDVQVNLPDAVLWSPSQDDNYGSYERGSDYGPLVVSETVGAGASGGGASARDSEISMWAMRSWGFRTSRITLGDGIDARLTKNANGHITGTVTNRTGKPLTRVWVGYFDRGQNLQTLKNGETRPVSFGPKQKLTPAEETRRRNQNRYGSGGGLTKALFDPTQVSNPYDYYGRQTTNPQTNRNTSPEQRLEAFRSAAAGGVQSAYDDSINNSPNGGETPPTEAFITAFNGDTLAPVTIDGQTVKSGMTVNILIVHVPLK